jgi:hypothetical protein
MQSFPGEKSTQQSFDDGSAADSRRREKSFEPIRTTLARKLPYLERPERSAFTVPEAHRKEIVQRSSASFEEHFRDLSS